MPRTWGYIFVLVALLVGVGALLLPMPEMFENTKPKAVPVARPQAPKARPSRPAKPKAAKAKPAKPTAKALALQDTTKARISVQPKAKK